MDPILCPRCHTGRLQFSRGKGVKIHALCTECDHPWPVTLEKPGLREVGFVPYGELIRWKLRSFVAWGVVLAVMVWWFAR